MLPYRARQQIRFMHKIITDLKDAETKLLPTYPSAGRVRPNLYTASALLAKVYLFEGQWQNAFNMADQVIGSGQYTLNPDLNTVFLDGSTEAIWQLPANDRQLQTPEGVAFIPYPNNIPNYSISDNLLKAFEPGDLRSQDWIALNQITGGASTQNYYYPFKYKKHKSRLNHRRLYDIFVLRNFIL